jgi:transposase
MTTTDCLSDARKIPDEAMNYIRRIAVHAIVDRHYSPELVAEVLNISRSSIYNWVSWYRKGGEPALDTQKAPGAPPVITPEMDVWLKDIILHSTPMEHGYDTPLWTLKILVELLKENYGIDVYESTVANHLHDIGLSCQVPQYQAFAFDPAEAERFLSDKWPRIQRLATKMGADIFFEDEAGVGVMTRSGRTWGEVNNPPHVKASDQRGGYNVLSAISPQGEMHYHIENKTISTKEYLTFLRNILAQHPRPIIILADRASFHRSKKAAAFVRKHRRRIRVFFLPKHAPKFNPGEQVWNEIKHRHLGREPIRNKADLKKRLVSRLRTLQRNTNRILSFFHLKDTSYAINPLSA